VNGKKYTALLIALTLAIAACGSPAATPTRPAQATPTLAQATPTPGQATPTPAQATTTPAAELIELSLLEHQDLRIQALKEVLPDFEAQMAAQGRNVKVNLIEQVMSDQEFQTKLALDYSSQNAADVIEYGAGLTTEFGPAGYLLDLTDRLAAWADWQQHFYPVIRERATNDDGINYYVPSGASVLQLFYRKDVFDANDVSDAQPLSWQELIDRMIELEAKTGKPPILFPAGTSWGGGTFEEGFIHVFLGTGGELYNQATGKWVVKSQALTDALGFYEDLVANDLLPVEALLNPNPWEPTKYVAFPAGDLAVTTQGSWGWRYDWGPDGAKPIDNLFDVVKTWEFPTQDGSGTFVYAGEGWAWTIHSQTEHPDEAWELVKFLTTASANATMITAVGDLAARDDISTLPPYSEQTVLVESEKLLPTGRFFKAQTGIDKIYQGIGQATEAILTKSKTAEEAAADFASDMTDLLGADMVEEQ
jgi:multiple sugar transport system substrate-binding protein